MSGMFSKPSIPKPPPPAPVADPSLSAEEQARMAQQRKALDERRAGRQSFVVPLPTVSGIRIPGGSQQ